MRLPEAEVLSNEPVAPSWRELVVSWDGAAGPPEPGQFMTVRATARYDPLLRRPLAFAGASPAAAGRAQAVRAIYQERGPATRLLARLGPGDRLDLLGPLGKPFPLPAPGEAAILAAGGIGLGPILFLARALAARGPAPLLVLGFRDASCLPSVDLPPGTVLCTDDGSAGERGLPHEWLARNAPAGRARLYGCGPAPMLAALASLAAARGWDASLSAEQWMACGVGACQGCALPRPGGSGYLRACADGPVFGLGEIDWAALARRAAAGGSPSP